MIILFIFLFFVNLGSSIIINEFEINPVGASEGTEWIELYNDGGEEIDLQDWEIWDGLSSPKKIYTIDEKVLEPEEYYVIELTGLKLNNNGEFITLYDSDNNSIDQTSELSDSGADINTWQYCDGEWKFVSSTKGEENDCQTEIIQEEEEETEQEVEETEEEKTEDEESEEEEIEQLSYHLDQEETEEKEIIKLNNPKDIKSPENKEESICISTNEKIKSYAIYAFALLCVFIIAMLLKSKN